MRRKLLLAAAAVAAAGTFAPLPGASAYCDPKFFEHTGYCNPCLLAAAHSQRPEPAVCPL
jgi:hypothetical protein